MKTLFAKILLWFVATAALAVLGSVAVSAVIDSASPRGYAPVLRTLRFHGGEAVHAYEEGGPKALAAFLDRIADAYEFEGILTDENGRALSGPSADFSSLVERGKRTRVFHDFSLRALVFASRVEGRDGQYWFFLLLPRARFGFWARVRHQLTLPHLWVIGCILLLSYGLARHLTKPVLQLRAAAERLGRGDFQARVRSDRKDELGELARTFDRMADRVEKAVTAQKQLLQDVSHELRSPLSRLAVAVELARTAGDPSQALDRVSREAERLNVLIGELLALSRDQWRPSKVDLSKLLAEVAEQVEIEAQARDCRLMVEAEPQLELTADEELLRRAIENITRNAVQYTDPGTVVNLSARRRDSQIEVTVQDAGPGVPEESLPRLFDPFYRVERDRDRATGGVGLGLSIARRSIELHGGTISATNTHPGLRVMMRVPAR